MIYQQQQRMEDPVPTGIAFKIFDKDDPDTIWPDLGSPPRVYELSLPGDWNKRIEVMVTDLRQAQVDYMEANNLLPPKDAEKNPFDFG